jgi:nucleotide-binding universal stress UspA family protein
LFQKALVPLDGSVLAEGILPWISRIATGFKMPLVLMSAVDSDAIDVPRGFGDREARNRRMEEIAERMESSLRDRFGEIAGDLSSHGVSATVRVTRGHPADEILRGAEEEGCDLIAMATHGRNVMGQGVLGNVTDKIVHSSNVPTLTILPENAADYDADSAPLSKVIVPLDGSELAEASLPRVEQLAGKLSLEIILVRAVNLSSMLLSDIDTAHISLEDEQTALSDDAAGYLEQVAARLRADGFKVSTEVLHGPPGQTIGEFGDQTPESMIVLTSRGRSGISRWVLGSVAETLVRVSGDPVLILPSGSSS